MSVCEVIPLTVPYGAHFIFCLGNCMENMNAKCQMWSNFACIFTFVLSSRHNSRKFSYHFGSGEKNFGGFS